MSDQPRRRVLVENPILPPYRLPFFQELSRSQLLDVHVAVGDARPGSGLESILQPTGVSIIPLKNVFLGSGPWMTIQRGLLRAVRTGHWDAIVATFDPRLPMNLLAARLARRKGIKFIWWGIGIRPRERYLKVYKYLAMNADGLILYSGKGKERLIDLGIPDNKLFVAWNSIDTEEIGRLFQPQPDRNRILCIGRFVPDRRVDLLIRSFGRALPSLRSDIRLTLVGDGPERKALESLALELGIDARIDWPGFIYDQIDLAPIFNSSLICVSPGRLGLSAIHSLAYGVPVLFPEDEPHGPEVENLKPGVNSFTFDARDEHQLATQLAQLTMDSETLASAGAIGQATVLKELSVRNMAKTFEDCVAFAFTDRVVQSN